MPKNINILYGRNKYAKIYQNNYIKAANKKSKILKFLKYINK